MDDSLTPGLKGVKLSNGTKYELTYRTLKNKPCFRKDGPAEVYLEETVIPGISTVPYLLFSSNAPFTLGTKYGLNNDGTLEYSTDIENWDEWNGSAIQSVNNAVYLRGTENTSFQVDDEGNPVIFEINTSGNNGVRCLGNIENLLDYATVARGEHPTMGNYHCFYQMFQDCTALTTAPELHAMTLANGCYEAMFSGCTSLTSAPVLPATTLAPWCYANMFFECTSLTEASELPATTLTEGCYNSMFYGCTSLTVAPDIPATTVASGCCQNMFNGCSSLICPPELHALQLEYGCYGWMFVNCSSIRLSDTQTDVYTMPYRIPTSGTGINAEEALAMMFDGTGGPVQIPSINTTYYLAVN